ncbi:low temperature requirement protein A [Micromonospora sp. LZ34]
MAISGGSSGAPSPQGSVAGARVTASELFFDLVFVFAFIQAADLITQDLSWPGLLRGLLVLAVLWWCWAPYTWLGNASRSDERFTRTVLLTVSAVMFVLALTIPEAFVDLSGGLSGPVVFAACYSAVRAAHLVASLHLAAGNVERRHQQRRFGAALFVGVFLLFTAALVPQRIFDDPGDVIAARTGLWAIAFLAEYGGVLLAGVGGWQLFSAEYWAERHRLIIIVALGESLVALGVGAADHPISWPVVTGAALGVLVTAALWWIYFDITSIVAEQRLRRAAEAERVVLALRLYTYLHLPMVVGIILIAAGLEEVLEVAGTEGVAGHWHGLSWYVLCLGVIVYLLAIAAFQWRSVRTIGWSRLATAVLIAVTIPVAGLLSALAGLAVVTALTVGLVAVEVVTRADAHRAARQAAAGR